MNISDLREDYLESYLINLDFGKRYLGCEFSNYEIYDNKQKEIVNKIKDYIENYKTNLNEGKSLILVGTNGTGKNHLVVSAVKDLIRLAFKNDYDKIKEYSEQTRKPQQAVKSWFDKRSNFIQYISIPELRHRLSVAIRENNVDEVIKECKKVKLLILDEFGFENVSEFFSIIYFQILDHRYKENKPVWLISNYDAKELESKVGKRITDRYINPSNLGLLFDFESYRQRRL